jgi:hypothetical protein
MKTTTMAALLGLASAALCACDRGASGTAAATGSSQTAASAKAEDLAGGTKHEPPVKPEEVAAGHWYCDMGTVHYSRAEEGDGKCALCGMKLKHKE